MEARSRVLLFIAGAAAGAIAGILLAPGKGSEIRKKVTTKGKDISDSLVDFYNSVSSKFGSARNGHDEAIRQESAKAKSGAHKNATHMA